MEASQLSWLADFTWGIAADVLRDSAKCVEYRDVIPPMTVHRLIDA